jgi:putative salt-induced outer membrane protein
MFKTTLVPLLTCGVFTAFNLTSLQAGTASASGKNPVSGKAPATGVCGHNPGPWDTSIYSGLALTDGTVDSLTLNSGFRSVGTFANSEALLFADYLYGETQSVTTSNALRAGAQFNFLLNDRAYLGLANGFLYDEVAAVDYRINVYPSLGYYFVKSETTKLAFEIGAGYTWEKQANLSREFFGLRAAERFEHSFANGAKLYQNVEYLPEAKDIGNYLLSAEVGLEVPLSDKFKWRLAVRDLYDSSPAAGLDKNDLTLLSGISYAIGGGAAASKCKICRAEAAAKPAPLPALGTWITTGSLGFSLTRGNSETSMVSAGFGAVKYTDNDETRLSLGGAYGKVGDTTNAQTAFANAQYNEVISGPLYLGAGVDFLHDNISALDYRITPAILLGAYLVKTDATKLALEVGPGWTFQKQGGVDDSFLSVVARERFETTLSSGTKFFQSISGLFNTDNSDDYVITAEAGVDMKIAGSVSLRVAVQDIYDAVPANGVEKNELRLTSGIAISF